jgi:hypothetical protein
MQDFIGRTEKEFDDLGSKSAVPVSRCCSPTMSSFPFASGVFLRDKGGIGCIPDSSILLRPCNGYTDPLLAIVSQNTRIDSALCRCIILHFCSTLAHEQAPYSRETMPWNVSQGLTAKGGAHGRRWATKKRSINLVPFPQSIYDIL